MRGTNLLRVAAAAATLLTLGACASTDEDPAGSEPMESEPMASEPMESEPMESEPMDGAALATAETDLGTIVVDGEGAVVYMFDQDTQGGDASTCEGECAVNWPAVPGSDMAAAEGLTGEVGTIDGVDGEPQLTLNGWPLYYFVGDEAPGDTAGQGVNDVWWVLDPAGEPITG